MSSGRGDLSERLRIDEVRARADEVRERADDVRERATEFYGRTVSSSDDSLDQGGSRRGDAGVSESTDGRFQLSTWLGTNPTGQTEDGERSVLDSGRPEESSTAAEGSTGAHGAEPGSTDSDPQFDFRGWLAEGGEDVAALDGTATGTADDGAAVRSPRSAVETTAEASATAEPAGFDFAGWVRTGDTDLDPIRDPAETDEEPTGTDDELAEPVADAADPVDVSATTDPARVPETVATGGGTAGAAGFDRVEAPSPTSLLEIHPVKAATLALFLAVVALAALSMGGYLPPLGPSTGLAF